MARCEANPHLQLICLPHLPNFLSCAQFRPLSSPKLLPHDLVVHLPLDVVPPHTLLCGGDLVHEGLEGGLGVCRQKRWEDKSGQRTGSRVRDK